jgi:hypothetical protein
MSYFRCIIEEHRNIENEETRMSVTEHAKNDMAAITGIDLAGYLVRDPERAVAF